MDTWDSPRFDWSYQYGDPSKPKYWLFYVGDWLVISGYDTREEIEASGRRNLRRLRLKGIAALELAIETASCPYSENNHCATCELTMPLRKLANCGAGGIKERDEVRWDAGEQ